MDGHWNFFRGNNYKIYALVGIGYIHSKLTTSESAGEYERDDSVSDGAVAGNFGIGGQYNFTEQWGAAFEAKYQVYSGGGQFMPAVSVMYRF